MIAWLSLGVNLSVDYEIQAGVASSTTLDSDAPVWDAAVWDVAVWGTETSKATWVTVLGIGYAGALRVKFDTSGQDVSWNGFNLGYERLEAFY